MNPKDEPHEAGPGETTEIRKELGSVIYAANVLGSRGPRKMQVAIPAVDENDRAVNWRAGSSPGDDILSRMKDKNSRDLAYLINKPPRWNDQVMELHDPHVFFDVVVLANNLILTCILTGDFDLNCVWYIIFTMCII